MATLDVRKKGITTKKLDTLFSKIIRSKGRCKNCGTDQRLQCAHLISRRYHQVRWDLNNATILCASCHLKYTYDPLGWEVFIEKSFGKKLYEELKYKARQYGKIDHKALYEELTKKARYILKD